MFTRDFLFIQIIILVNACRVPSGEVVPYRVHERIMNIDADTSDWSGIKAMEVNEKSHLWIGQGMVEKNWQGPEDLSFIWKSARNGNKLCFLFIVRDDSVGNFNQSNTWLNDCIELCIDPQRTRGIRKDTINGIVGLHGYEMHFLPSIPPHAFFHDEKSLYFTSQPQDQEFRSDWQGEIAARYIKNGYIMEMAFSIPGLNLTKNKTIGFEAAVCDDDGNGRKSLITWTGNQNDYWVNMNKYGKLVIK